MRLVMLELLRHPTPELPCTLKDAIAVLAWEYGSYYFLMDRPGNLPAIQGKLPVKHLAGG